LILITLILLVACGEGQTDGMEVSGVWGRVSPAAAENGAFYMAINNQTGEDDALVAVRSDVCRAVELHESALDDEGVMSMRPMQEIAVPAGETVGLEVAGLHVMCIGVVTPFTLGDRVPLTLVFDKAGMIDVDAEIRTGPPEMGN
jgi:copper(I)-binding protein